MPHGANRLHIARRPRGASVNAGDRGDRSARWSRDVVVLRARPDASRVAVFQSPSPCGQVRRDRLVTITSRDRMSTDGFRFVWLARANAPKCQRRRPPRPGRGYARQRGGERVASLSSSHHATTQASAWCRCRLNARGSAAASSTASTHFRTPQSPSQAMQGPLGVSRGDLSTGSSRHSWVYTPQACRPSA